MSSDSIDWKGVIDSDTKRLNLGRMVISAIAEYDEDFYEEVTKHAEYPNEEDDKYHDGTANYDDDVDVAEMLAIVDFLWYVVTNHHPHKVGYILSRVERGRKNE